jgi:hypothetical protein
MLDCREGEEVLIDCWEILAKDCDINRSDLLLQIALFFFLGNELLFLRKEVGMVAWR